MCYFYPYFHKNDPTSLLLAYGELLLLFYFLFLNLKPKIIAFPKFQKSLTLSLPRSPSLSLRPPVNSVAPVSLTGVNLGIQNTSPFSFIFPFPQFFLFPLRSASARYHRRRPPPFPPHATLFLSPTGPPLFLPPTGHKHPRPHSPFSIRQFPLPPPITTGADLLHPPSDKHPAPPTTHSQMAAPPHGR